jgi:ATP/maltotriose-dependent transcriptional regulator MalT
VLLGLHGAQCFLHIGETLSMSTAIERGRESFQSQGWGDAYAQLSAADKETPLEPDDLERLAVAAFLVGRDADSVGVWERAHQACLSGGETTRAARCAFWLGFTLVLKGETARGGAWLARLRRLLDEYQTDCAEEGFFLVAVALQKMDEGEAEAAYATSEEISAIADRFSDPDLVAISRLVRGQALIQLGDTAQGVAWLDEVMISVTSNEVSPLVVGLIYCAVIEAFQAIFDLHRAKEWTAALSHWCESQPDLVPYRGQCLVHRAEIMQLHGAWPDAIEEAKRAGDWLSRPPGHPAVGMAFYQQAELRRLCGEFPEAEEAYRQATRWGRSPQPGLAQLRLAQGQADAAEAAINSALDEAQELATRSRLLAAYVEILLAGNSVPAARSAADELSGIASKIDAPMLHAMAAHASGSVLLAEGAHRDALTMLRRAWSGWRKLEAPYEAARVRVLVGLAYRSLGDDDTAEMELDAARWVFQQLGAAPDLARVEELSRAEAARPAGGLTAREVQVLALVAKGETNKAIAAELVLSERTVERHVSNIFNKLGVSSRTAATAHAFQHQLI